MFRVMNLSFIKKKRKTENGGKELIFGPEYLKLPPPICMERHIPTVYIFSYAALQILQLLGKGPNMILSNSNTVFSDERRFVKELTKMFVSFFQNTVLYSKYVAGHTSRPTYGNNNCTLK